MREDDASPIPIASSLPQGTYEAVAGGVRKKLCINASGAVILADGSQVSNRFNKSIAVASKIGSLGPNPVPGSTGRGVNSAAALGKSIAFGHVAGLGVPCTAKINPS